MSTLSDAALCGVSDVRESLGISGTSKDNLIIRKINQATGMIENWCGRTFALTNYIDEAYNTNGGDTLNLRNYPVTELTSLSLRTSATDLDDWRLIEAEFYYIDLDAGIIDTLFQLGRGFQRWKATYSAGYDPIPDDLAEACAQLAAYLVARGPVTFGAQELQEGARRTRYNTSPNPLISPNEQLFADAGVLATLDYYRATIISGLA